jgi:ABC-type Fe3+ transport system permease subunit
MAWMSRKTLLGYMPYILTLAVTLYRLWRNSQKPKRMSVSGVEGFRTEH